MWLRVLLVIGLALLALVGYLNPRQVPPASNDTNTGSAVTTATPPEINHNVFTPETSIRKIGYTHVNAHFHSLPTSIATREKDLAGKVEEVKKIAADAGTGEVEVRSLTYTLDSGQEGQTFRLQGNITFRLPNPDNIKAVVDALRKQGFIANESGWCG